MCIFKKKETPKLVVNSGTISRDDFVAQLREYGIVPIDLGTPLDSNLNLTSKSELDRIAPSLTYPADLYVEQIWDCEDYALQAQCDAARIFHVSGVRMGLGNMPLGYHGFVLALDSELKLWLLEPNSGFDYAGKWFKTGENGYTPGKAFV